MPLCNAVHVSHLSVGLRTIAGRRPLRDSAAPAGLMSRPPCNAVYVSRRRIGLRELVRRRPLRGWAAPAGLTPTPETVHAKSLRRRRRRRAPEIDGPKTFARAPRAVAGAARLRVPERAARILAQPACRRVRRTVSGASSARTRPALRSVP